MSARPADEFVELFNELSGALERLLPDQSGGHWKFYELVEQAAHLHPIIRDNESRLRGYGDLRNVIVHHPGYPDTVVAEPSAETIAVIREVLAALAEPLQLFPRFRKDLRSFSSDDRLIEAIGYMGENDFSQSVVRDVQTRAISLLTTEGVARWLGVQRERQTIEIGAALVSDALPYEPPGAFVLMSRRHTVDDARRAFAPARSHPVGRLNAIIITENGRAHESPLGIVTPWDLFD